MYRQSQIIYKTIHKYFFKEKNAFSPFIESSWADLLNLPLLSIMFPRKLYSLAYNTSISSLSFADDLVILSESQAGLQNSLNKLEKYCYKWQLKLNTNKTKIMIFQKYLVIKYFKIKILSVVLWLTRNPNC
jgi:hypothetical protein